MRQRDRAGGVAGVAEVAQGGERVVVLGAHHPQRRELAGAAQLRVVRGRPARRGSGRRDPRTASSASLLGEPVDAVLAQGLQHPVAARRRAPAAAATVDQGGEQLRDLGRRHRGAGADRGGRGRRHAAGQDRDAFGHRTLVLAEQIPAPGDDRAQRAVPRQRGPAARGEQPEPVGQPGGELGQRQRAQPGRGQLQGQRHAVQAAHHPQHLVRACRSSTSKPGRTAAARSVNSRTDAARRASSTPSLRAGQRQRAERDQRLAVDRERLAAGRQHPQPGAARQQRCDQVRDGVDQVLAVVHHEQALAAVELVGEHVQLVALGPHPAGASKSAAPRSPIAASRAAPTLAGSVTEDRSTSQVPSRYSWRCRRAASSASRVLPAPPGPTTVTRRPRGEQRVDPGEVVVAPDEAGQRRRAGCSAGASRRASGRAPATAAGAGGARAGRRPGRRRAGRRGSRGPARSRSRASACRPWAASASISSAATRSSAGCSASRAVSRVGGRVGAAQRQLGLGQVGRRLDRGAGQPGRDRRAPPRRSPSVRRPQRHRLAQQRRPPPGGSPARSRSRPAAASRSNRSASTSSSVTSSR